MNITQLTVRYGAFTAVDDVSLDIPPGGAVGLVGESGSGKSTLARALVGLAPVSAGTITGIPVGHAQMVFQDPYHSLDPRLTVGASVAEGIRLPRGERATEVARLLDLVTLDAAVASRYPRELSGGQRQRVAIARALGARPELLVADEITSALDVSVQGAILNLIRDLRARLGLAVLFISHNLAVVRYVADVIAVMHNGRLVEVGPTDEVINHPREDYTRTLMAAVPGIGDGL
ncbi:ABC transporter ATP-binding protein [Streptosporangium amethystogenes]|uniref:ABC transporter ATP-binding protein n=1 Tax=Streptosporangium amethystogenes TaxID=2002 RepID=UPI0004C8B797|nr:ATP-binding cassette domain-containing protein [Streptosporangium amethystogenes]